MRLNAAERESFRKRLKMFFVNKPNIKKNKIVNHFEKEGFARSTIYDNLKRLETVQSFSDRKHPGRPTSWTREKKAELTRFVNNRKGVSQRKIGIKFGVNQSTIGRQLKKMNIKYRKREKTPKYTIEQQLKAKKRSGKLVNQLYNTKSLLIIDDEKYFCFAGDNIPGNSGYYTNNKKTCPESVRFIGKEKFPKKLLMWIAISSIIIIFYAHKKLIKKMVTSLIILLSKNLADICEEDFLASEIYSDYLIKLSFGVIKLLRSLAVTSKKLRLFGNIVHKPIIYGPPNSIILELIPLMELQLLFGVVNHSFQASKDI